MQSAYKLLYLQKLNYGKYSDNILQLLKISYITAIGCMSEILSAKEDIAENAASGIRFMYSLTADFPNECDKEAFKREISAAVNFSEISPMLYGVTNALLYKCRMCTSDEYAGAAENYLLSAAGKDAADFIGGIIKTGRDVILSDQRFIESIDSFIKRTDSERFMEILPDLRRAFTEFTPSETERVSENVAVLYGKKKDILEVSGAFTASETAAAYKSDRKAREIMERWGLL